MDFIEVKTLIDITNTKVIRLSQGTPLQMDQQRNFATLMQCIEIRSIVFYESSPLIERNQDVKKLGFGSAYTGKHTVWTFRFSTDRDAVYMDNDGDPVGCLIEDMHEVPVIKNLTETINITRAVFDCKDSKLKNTLIKIVSDES